MTSTTNNNDMAEFVESSNLSLFEAFPRLLDETTWSADVALFMAQLELTSLRAQHHFLNSEVFPQKSERPSESIACADFNKTTTKEVARKYARPNRVLITL